MPKKLMYRSVVKGNFFILIVMSPSPVFIEAQSVRVVAAEKRLFVFVCLFVLFVCLKVSLVAEDYPTFYYLCFSVSVCKQSF